MTSSSQTRVEALVAQMTLDEKIAQVGSCWIYELQSAGELDPHKMSQRLQNGIGQITRLGGASTLAPAEAAKAANRIQKQLVEQTRLGIPAIIHEECCSGLMTLGGSMFPQMLGLAGTFQPELAEAMAGAIRRQMRAIGARQGLAPVLDVARDARWGRSEETFGEDPILVSHFGAAYIRGLQTPDLRDGVLATGKHFVGHSSSQGGLNCGPTHVGPYELRDVFLGPFQAAVRDAGLGAIMNAYPELDGEVVAASRRILTDLLRGELGFDGLIVSDYEAIPMIHTYHRAAADLQGATRLALEAGIDVELPCSWCYSEPLRAALDAGEISLDLLDEAVRRHLQVKAELGLFEQPYADEGTVVEVFDTTDDRALAGQIARQSMTLLKNDGILPLSKSIKTVAVIGPNADSSRNLLGDYSYASIVELLRLKPAAGSMFEGLDLTTLDPAQVKVVSVAEGIRALVSKDTQVLVARGCDNLDPDRSGVDEALEAAAGADAVVLALGDRSGMVPNCTTGEFRDTSDLGLPGLQAELARRVFDLGKPTVVVLVNGRPLAIPELAERANAILEAWLPGEEGGSAISETLFGDVNPAGRLAMTMPRSAGQAPIFYNHKPSGMRSNTYVDYVSEPVTPLYPFGHGLSYTTFEYTELSLSQASASAGEQVDIVCSVTNTGERAGEEVVQLYVCDEYASMPRPVMELKGYARIALQPGECKQVTFHLPVNMLAFFDQTLDLVVEPGAVQVMIGGSSQDIRLRGALRIAGDGKTCIEDRVFTCAVDIL